jgi:hypothetical protein
MYIAFTYLFLDNKVSKRPGPTLLQGYQKTDHGGSSDVVNNDHFVLPFFLYFSLSLSLYICIYIYMYIY